MYDKKKFLILGGVIACIVFLLVLWNFSSSGNRLAKEPEGDITAFYYDYGSYFGGYYTYELVRRYDGTVAFTATGGNGVDLDIYTYVDSSCLDELTEIVNESRIYTWNGFNKSDNGLMDGYGFSLAAGYSDGRILSAHGYGKEPSSYNEGHKALTAFFEKLCDNYDVSFAQENPGVIGNIEYFIYTYKTPECGKKTYYLTKNKTGSVEFEVSGEGLETKKTVDISVVQKLENLISEKEIYKWDGFDEEKNYSVEDQGFSLLAGYENNRWIMSSGAEKYPEGYESGHQALVEFFEALCE
ncbi:hypothetical protein [Butyrivibrio sp. XPD2006]|uniref:hypothetical protein n=1 Tax=Butyrivibrio sp. XPD2006 TaxID=1280668 RepID=UPI0003B47B9E|nr:hypothetical protein [Butyrivibrio sp. XPD2006]